MKALHFIAPTLSILAAGFWLPWQETALDDYEEKRLVLQAKIHKVVSKSNPPSPAQSNNRQLEITTSDGAIDWDITGPLLTEADQDTTISDSQKVLTKLLLHFQTASPEEIETALAQLKNLALSKKLGQRLEAALIEVLAKESPADALSLTGNAITSYREHLHRAQGLAFFHLSKHDPSAALTWLDDQIEKGHMEGTSLYPANNPRFAFEAPLIKHLAETNLTAANARISQLSSEEKLFLFRRSHLWNSGAPPSATFLKLARLNLPESQINSTIQTAWYPYLNPPSLKTISQTLAEIPFSDQERSSLLSHTIRSFSRAHQDQENLAKIYHWSKERDPDQARRDIVSSIIDSAPQSSNERAFQATTQLAQTVEDPQIPTEFAQQFYQRNKRNLEDQLARFQAPALANELRRLIEALPRPQ